MADSRTQHPRTEEARYDWGGAFLEGLDPLPIKISKATQASLGTGQLVKPSETFCSPV